MRKVLTLVLAGGLLVALPSTHSQSPRSSRELAGLRSAIEAVRPEPSPLFLPQEDGCVAHFISCGQTVTSQITTNDCATDPPPIFFDLWFFQGTAGQTITATLTSNDFDPFLILLDPDANSVAEDDDSGPGNGSRIVHTLDETSPDWTLVPTPLEANVTGSYTLSLQCVDSCPAGFFGDPNYPDFCFRVEIGDPGSTIPGTREADCLDETVCVSGALPGRSEAFLRLIGPRPNGFLWPTIVRFTPSRLVVDFHQKSSGQTNQYILPAVPPGTDELPGLQDRTGFLP